MTWFANFKETTRQGTAVATSSFLDFKANGSSLHIEHTIMTRLNKNLRDSVYFISPLLLLISAMNSLALPERLGDLDEDGNATIFDIVILGNHISGNQPLTDSLVPFADVNQDGLVNDSDVDIIAQAVIDNSNLPIPVNAPAVSAPSNGTNQNFTTLTGTSDPNSTIEILGGLNDVITPTDTNGRFNVNVPLTKNTINRLFITRIDQNNDKSIPRSLNIVQDSQPPSLFIDFPRDGDIRTNESILVAGRVGDLLSGFMGLAVAVNGESANVVIGIGTNGTFEKSNVPLPNIGENTITITAADIYGNAITKTINVIRQEISGPSMIVSSGNLQQGIVNHRLLEPLEVKVSHADGNAFSHKIIEFEVIRSNGRLTPDPTSNSQGKTSLQVRTDANGVALAWWTLGSDAGCGNNRVGVTSRDIDGITFFCASANPAPAAQINIGTGNNQKAEVGGPAPEALRVWINDTCNGVGDIPVTFSIIKGDGKVNSLDQVTVTSAVTGHTEVKLTLGPNGGQNIIEADFPGNIGNPAVFVIEGIKPETQVTSFAGLVLDNASQPIVGAICSIEVSGQIFPDVSTDVNGQFLLNNLTAGPGHLRINGFDATQLGDQTIPTGMFPVLAYEVIVIANTENSLPGPILLPELNPDNVRSYDGTADVVLTIEGVEELKMIVKAGSMTRADGTTPTPGDPAEIALNQVHHDDIPMPMPDGAAPPFAWTLQPSGATFDPPVEIVYPNMSGLPAGTITYFLSFNHASNRFVIVATGHIIENGLCAVTDPESGISTAGWGGVCPPYPATGNVSSTTSKEPASQSVTPASSICPVIDDKSTGTDPVYLFSGEFYTTVEDLRIKGRGLDFVWARKYRSKVGQDTDIGNNWDFSYNIFIEADRDDIFYCDGNSRRDRFRPIGDGRWARIEQFSELTQESDGSFTLLMADRTEQRFFSLSSTVNAGKISSFTDRNGNTISFTYNSNGKLSTITDTLDRDINVAYNTDGFIESVTDFLSRKITYDYYADGDSGGSFGDLKSVTYPVVTGTPNGNDFPNGKTVSYTYSTGFNDDRLNHNLLTITDGRRNDPNDSTNQLGPYVTNIYADTTNANDFTFDRVIRQNWGDPGDITDIDYASVLPTSANNRAVTKAIVNDRNGNVKEYFYDIRNREVIKREFTGIAISDMPTTEIGNRPENKFRSTDPDFFETQYEYNNNALLKRTVSPNGNIMEYVYESEINTDTSNRNQANVRIRRLLPGSHTPEGDQSVIEEFYEYDTNFGCASGCGFNFVTRHTDGRGNITINQYDDNGNLVHKQHRISTIIEDFTYNQFGQMTSRSLPDNGGSHRRQDQFTYYDSGSQQGYLKNEIVDAGNLALTTIYEYDLVGNIIRKVDPRGNDTQYEMNALDQIVRESSRVVGGGLNNRYQRDFFYDANNNLIRIDIQNIDEIGVLQSNTHFTTTFVYEILNNFVSKTEEIDGTSEIVTEYTYDRNRNQTLIRYGEAVKGNQPKNTVLIVYDERDLPYLEIRADGHADESTTQFNYDGNRNLLMTHQGIESQPRITEHSYDGYNRLVTTFDPMGNVSEFGYDANHNRVFERQQGEVIDVAGDTGNIRLSESANVYDEMDRIINNARIFFDTESATQDSILDGLSTTQMTYNDNSQVVQVTNDNNHTIMTVYDTANRKSLTTDAKANNMAYTYDANSNITAVGETELSDTGQSTQLFTTHFAYDGLDRRIMIVDNIGNTQNFYYDSRDNQTTVIDALGNMTQSTFDGINRPLQTIRSLTDTGSGIYTSASQINVGGTSRSRPVPNSPTNETDTITTSQGWDETSRLISQTDDNGNATVYTYDPLNRKVATTYADNTTHQSSYDIHDNPIAATDANGSQTASEFDLLNRITRKDITVGTNVGNDTTFETYKYDGLSRLVHAEDDDSIVSRRYDSLSNIITETLNGKSTQCAYDGVGNMLMCTYPGGRTITCIYDELERKKTIFDQNGSIASYNYIGPARVENRDYNNGIRTDYNYDGITGISNPADDFGVKRIIKTSHIRQSDNVIVDDRSYQWDRMYNKSQRNDTRTGGLQLAYDYSYDSVYRLQDTNVTDMNTITTRDTDYTYDGVGNRTTIVENGSNLVYTMNSSDPDPADSQTNQYTTTPHDTRSYDLNGNLVLVTSNQSSVTSYQYDYRNQLVSFSVPGNNLSATYTYDALGRRIAKQISDNSSLNTVHYFYHNWQVIEEQDASDLTEATYVYGLYIDEVLNMQRDVDDDTLIEDYYYHTDDLYNVVAITDSSGAVVERYDYDDFGKPSISIQQSSIQNPYLFTGRRLDPETDFYHYRTRYLAADVGRFTTRDTIGIWGDEVEVGNGYTYVGNGPGSFVDPNGNFVWFIPLVFLGGGSVTGLGAEVSSDYLDDGSFNTNWEKYTGSAIGGAAFGASLLYNPQKWASGAIGNSVGNSVTQGLENLTGNRAGFNAGEFISDTGLGLVPGFPKGGANYLSMIKQLSTKYVKDLIKNVESKTAGKILRHMFLAQVNGKYYQSIMDWILEPIQEKDNLNPPPAKICPPTKNFRRLKSGEDYPDYGYDFGRG